MDDFIIALMMWCIFGSCLFSFLSFVLNFWVFIERKIYINAVVAHVLEYLGFDLTKMYKDKKRGVSNEDIIREIKGSVVKAADLIDKDAKRRDEKNNRNL